MVTVHLSAGLRDLTGGVAVIESDAGTVGRLVKELDTRFPGLGERLGSGTSVAIDGEILTDADFEPLPDGCEVHFLQIHQGG
jgi:molybdopterin converting factor small subunit